MLALGEIGINGHISHSLSLSPPQHPVEFKTSLTHLSLKTVQKIASKIGFHERNPWPSFSSYRIPNCVSQEV